MNKNTQIVPLERAPIDTKLKALGVTKEDIIDAVWDLPVNSYSDGEKIYFVEFSDNRDMSNTPLDLEILSEWYEKDLKKIPSIPIDKTLVDFVDKGCSGILSRQYNEGKPQCCSKLIEDIDWEDYDNLATQKKNQQQISKQKTPQSR